MTAEKPMNEFPVMDTSDGIVLFHPNIPAKAAFNVSEVLNTRWIGQGPRVDEFEQRFEQKFTVFIGWPQSRRRGNRPSIYLYSNKHPIFVYGSKNRFC